MTGLSRRQVLGLTGAGLLLGPAMHSHAQPALRCGVFDLAPWSLRDGPIPGIGADLVAALAQEAGLGIDPIPAPHTRLVRDIRVGQFDMVIFAALPELEQSSRVLGTLAEVELGVILRHDFAPRTLDDFAGRTIAQVRGGGNLAILDALKHADRVEVSDVTRGLDMIVAGRLDGYVGARLAIDWQIRQAHLDPGHFGGFFPLSKQPVRLYGHTERAWTKDELARLGAACPKVKAGFRAICARYLTGA